MADSEQTTTKVRVDEAVKFGQFANAFRIVEEVGPDCFLDFMVYSADCQEATVISRVRVRREFLPSIRKTLGEAISEFPGDKDQDLENSRLFRKKGETLH